MTEEQDYRDHTFYFVGAEQMLYVSANFRAPGNPARSRRIVSIELIITA